MKPGSLVIMLGYQVPGVLMFGQVPAMFGIVLSKSKWSWSNSRSKPYRWWEVLCGDNIIVEAEYHLKLVE